MPARGELWHLRAVPVPRLVDDSVRVIPRVAHRAIRRDGAPRSPPPSAPVRPPRRSAAAGRFEGEAVGRAPRLPERARGERARVYPTRRTGSRAASGTSRSTRTRWKTDPAWAPRGFGIAWVRARGLGSLDDPAWGQTAANWLSPSPAATPPRCTSPAPTAPAPPASPTRAGLTGIGVAGAAPGHGGRRALRRRPRSVDARVPHSNSSSN